MSKRFSLDSSDFNWFIFNLFEATKRRGKVVRRGFICEYTFCLLLQAKIYR